MKKSLLIISLAFAFNYSVSQTITSSNIVILGDTIFSATDNSPSISLGTTGIGNNWNFSSLLANSRDTVVFLHPYTIPCAAAEIPSGTHSFREDTNRAFLSLSTAKLELVGLSNGTICVESQNAESIIEFPSSFGSTFNDTALTIATVTGASVGQPIADSIRVENEIFIESDFNASGSLTTPFGIFTVIRQEVTRRTKTDTYAKGALTGGVYTLLTSERDTSISHQYWSDAPNAKFPLVTYEIDNAGNLTGGLSWTFKYGANPNVSLKEEKKIEKLNLFPNPTTNQLTFDMDERMIELMIHDMTGKKVYALTNTMNKTIDVSNFDNGVYVVTVRTESGVYTNKFIKE